jgi:hypothetical protein
MVKEIQAGIFTVNVVGDILSDWKESLRKKALYLKTFIVWIEEHSKELS